MKIEDIELDIESIKEIASIIYNPITKASHLQYCESMENVEVLLSSPILFMSFAISKIKETHISIENSVKLNFLIEHAQKKEPGQTAKDLVNFFKEGYEKENETTVEEAFEEAKLLIQNNPKIKDLYHSIGLNALVNSWTLFETSVKDLWINTLNKYPNLLNNSLLNSKSESENSVLGKNIPISFLSKYGYNISEHLGVILVGKYDFTGTSGMKRAYKDLLNLSELEIKLFDDINLNQLEITRHLIVHKASIIDEDYLKRSKRPNEILRQKLILEGTEACSLINSSIKTLKEILILVDQKINHC